MQTKFTLFRAALKPARMAPALTLLASGLIAGLTAYAQEPAIVGEATMVIGVAKVVGSDGQPRTVDRGTTIRVGDRIETQAGGHVHLRFVDGGRLSIRPASSLQVEDYSHSSQQPLMGAIKFRLDEGVVRSITGAWGEAARDRFRLNTPVAAIGVKGTDFVVMSDSDKTSASVYTGAIMLTPLASGCSKSVGPCLNGNEKFLSEDMKGQMLELGRQQTTPQLVPLVDLLARNARPPAAATETVARLDKPLALEDAQADARTSKTLGTDNRAMVVVSSIPPPVAVTPPPAVVEVPVVPIAPPEIRPIEVAVVPPQPEVVIPVVPVVPAGPPQVNQLIWGRFTWTPLMNGDIYTRKIGDAALAGYEALPVNFNYLLYRLPAAPGAVLASADASANFRLASGSANLVTGVNNPVELANINSGSFYVDFTRATFSTQLNVSNPTMGNETVAANGTVKSNGTLQSVGGSVGINGALTLDGKEAGYAFNKQVSAGMLSGISLWGR